MAAALDRVTAALAAAGSHQARANGDWTCPAHEDSTPSLSVTNGDGKVLLHCHGGCETGAVLKRIGLRARDLFDEAPQPARPPITYDYVDEKGRLLFQVVRLTPKGFRQRRPDGAGGWVWNTKDTRRVLYRLPEVLAAAAIGDDMFIVEGEKDVEAIRRAGRIATCNPGGAGKWRNEYIDSLKGCDRVFVVADRDDKGIEHARQVAASLERVGITPTICQAAVGKDAADHLGAGRGLDEFEVVELDDAPAANGGHHDPVGHRSLRVTRASDISPRPVRWLWRDRIALGSLALLGGREGIGKSTVAYWLVAAITRGTLPGQYHGQPRSIIVAATEDSWEYTIVPRLMAAGADLDRVLRVDVIAAEGFETQITLPADLLALEQLVAEENAALILLDPLLSRLDVNLDTHKDAEVRRALEPLVALADRSNAAILGLIHVNKGTSTDPLTLLMGSRAFAAVARAVLFAIADPDDDNVKHLGQPKTNLGRTDLPTLNYRIVSAHVADTLEGPVVTGKVEWLGEENRSIRDLLEATGEDVESRTATGEAAEWLGSYLASVGGISASAKVKEEGKRAGHTADALKRARIRVRATVESSGFPRTTFWRLPVAPVGAIPGESAPTAPSTPTAPTRGSQSVQSVQSVQPPRERAPTGKEGDPW
jgi:5S rRNA maturation endonuclease (ribonuclease M5)